MFDPIAAVEAELHATLPSPELIPLPAEPNGGAPAPVRPNGVQWWRGIDLMTAAFPEPRWAVPGLVAEGANLLVGPPKAGKSWFALGLALAVAAGGKALGKVDVEQGKVALLALEDTPRRLQTRARMLLGEEPMPEGLGVTFDAPRLGDGLVEALDATDTTGLRIVIIDVLARIRPVTGSESVYDRDYAAMAAVKTWSDGHNVPVLVLHHTRKAKSDDFMDLISGSHGLGGAADSILVLRRARTSADAVLSITGRDVEEAEHALRFDATRGAWTLLDGPASDYGLGDTRRRIIEVLRENGAMRPKAIAAELSEDYELVKKTVQRMAHDEQLDTDGAGLYLVPTDPLSLLSPVSPDSVSVRDSGDSGDSVDAA